ncbi:hypothetical protein QCA50_019893 [Cerrena zonata]|uniref:Pseudouridine synthase RsuA/RluA-like domain-containing protein n=1 Tax=Cerrena zonata TaxID=2478898 RepID=A0AAW0FGC6_9APHY
MEIGAIIHPLLYVDSGAVIINKPPNLVCQLGEEGQSQNNRGSDHGDFKSLLTDIQETLGLKEFPYPLHRLDKLTTGTLAVALNRQTARDISQQLQARTLDKTYLAIVRGGGRSFTERSGVISNYLICDAEGTVSVTKNSEWPKTRSQKDRPKWLSKSETHWELVNSSPSLPLSLMKLTLRTGLKHQLRVHMAQTLQAPILGDRRYASAKISKKITEIVNIPQDTLFLHASSLSFNRYFPKQTRIKVVAPLPGYFTKLCAKIGIQIPIEYTRIGVWKDDVEVKNVIQDFLNQQSSQASPIVDTAAEPTAELT